MILLTSEKNINKEYGGAMIMAWLAILMFLFIAILMLDVPYIERVGRATQRAVDAAALAGAVQLQRSSIFNVGDQTAQLNAQQIGWRNSKRAAFFMLRSTNNSIPGAASINFTTPRIDPTRLQVMDPLDLEDVYSVRYYTQLSSSGNPASANLDIQRGYYERQNAGTTQPSFISLEVGSIDTRNHGGTSVAANLCRRRSSSVLFPSICPVGLAPPAPAVPMPAVSVANSMRITLTINNVPTLFAKLIGVNSFTSVTRTATAVPQ